MEHRLHRVVTRRDVRQAPFGKPEHFGIDRDRLAGFEPLDVHAEQLRRIHACTDPKSRLGLTPAGEDQQDSAVERSARRAFGIGDGEGERRSGPAVLVAPYRATAHSQYDPPQESYRSHVNLRIAAPRRGRIVNLELTRSLQQLMVVGSDRNEETSSAIEALRKAGRLPSTPSGCRLPADTARGILPA